MILYVHFNNETGEMKMLQIPRDTMVTTDRSVSGNYRINNIAKTQAADSNSMNMAALCEQISNMYQLPIDGYMTIRLEMLVQLVDTFGGIELYVPQEMDYKGSHLDQGYQTLNGDACEFLLRTRHVYNNGDIGRLNMQRQFYSALFRRLKSIGNIWDVAKLTPAVLNYMETSLSASKLVSFAVSMLKIDSSKIMICQMPVKMAGKYNGEAVVYPAVVTSSSGMLPSSASLAACSAFWFAWVSRVSAAPAARTNTSKTMRVRRFVFMACLLTCGGAAAPPLRPRPAQPPGE